MPLLFIVFLCLLALNARVAEVDSATKWWPFGIDAPSSNDTDVPSPLTSTVPMIESSCPVSDFTSTLWFCPSMAAIPSATGTASITATSTPAFSPSRNPQPANIEELAPGLPVAHVLCIAGLVVFFTILNIYIKYNSRQAHGGPIDPPEESLLSCWDSIVDGTYYDWHNSDSLGSTINFPHQVLDIAVREWYDERAREAEAKWNAREKTHKIEITDFKTKHDEAVTKKLESETREHDLKNKINDMNAEFDERVKGLETELAERMRALGAKITENKERESAHEYELAAKERDHKSEIKNIDEKQKRFSDRVQTFARIRHRALLEETNKRKAAERKLDTVQKGLIGMLFNTGFRFGLPKPTAQDAAHDSTTDHLLLAPAAAESSTAEVVEASPAETASPVATPTPELDSSELKAEASPQDVAPGDGDQLPVPPTSSESLTTEAKDASPAATESTSEFSAASPSESGAEQQQQDQHEHEQFEEALEQQHEHEEEQKEELEEQEPQDTEVPLQEPSSMGEGAEQSHQEKDVAHDAPVPTEEQAASPQLTEPEAAPDHTASNDGAFEAPVTTEVLPEEQTGNRETEEPTAVEEIIEAPVTTSSNDGASMASATNETKTVRFVDGNGHEVRITEEIDQTPPVSTGHILDEPADEMDVDEESAASDHPGGSSKSAWEIFISSPRSSNATTDDLDDEAEVESSNEIHYSMYGMEMSNSEGTDIGHGAEQSDSAAGTNMDLDDPDDGQAAKYRIVLTALARFSIEQPTADEDSRMGDDGNDDATNATGSQRIDMADAETAQPLHQDGGNDQGLPSQINITPATEMARFTYQASGNGQVLSSHVNHPPATETAQFSRQAYGNGQVPPFQSNGMATTETPQNGSQPSNNDHGISPIFTNPPKQPSPADLASQNASEGVVKAPDDVDMSEQDMQPTPTPTPQTGTYQPLRTGEKPKLPQKDVIVEEMNKINKFAVQANTASAQWMRTPDEGGPDDAALQRMRSDPDSQFTNIIEDAKYNAEYLENGFQKQLERSPLSAGAETVARDWAIPAVKSMREKYGELNKCKNSPHLFMFLLMNIDRMLKVLRDLVPESAVPESPTPPAQAQQPALGMQSTQVLSLPTPTPQTGTQTSPSLASTAKDWPLDNAKMMNAWAVHANGVSREWLSSPEYAGLDGNAFQLARDDPNSQFSRIILDAANWVRYLKTDIELKKSPLSAGAQTVFRYAVPAVRKMREQYSALSQGKGVPHLFVDMLRDIDCILKELSVLVPESPTPPAQSTQQGLSQPTPQTAGTGQQSGNYLYSYGNPLQAVKEIEKRVQEIDQLYRFWEPNTKRDRSGNITSKGTDAEDFAHWDKDGTSRFRAVKRQVKLTANWLENRGQRHPQAEAMLRDQVNPLMKKMRDKTNAIGPMKGCAPLFNDLLGDFVRIVKELNRIN